MGGSTHGHGVVGEGGVKFFWQTSTLAMWMVNNDCLGLLGEKLAGVKVEKKLGECELDYFFRLISNIKYQNNLRDVISARGVKIISLDDT